MTGQPFLIYGAYGYTGELITREAVRRGLEPMLAGRHTEPLERLAHELDLRYRTCGLDNLDTLSTTLDGMTAVLHCAGPFVHTSRPMVDACLAAGCHYLDITGEISVFESIFRRHDEAQRAGIALLPGTGLDVVPTDCLAAHLHDTLPGGTHLELALATGSSASRGTLVTMIEALPHLGAERVDGEIVSRPAAFATREIPFSHRPLAAMAIPWGDLATAYRTTGVPNIRVYLATSKRQIRRLRRLAPVLGALASRPAKRLLQGWIRRARSGPSAQVRATARCHFWGSISDGSGRSQTATLETPEGYQLTAMTAIEILERVLSGSLQPGAWTPAAAFGPDLIRSVDNVTASW